VNFAGFVASTRLVAGVLVVVIGRLGADLGADYADLAFHVEALLGLGRDCCSC